ncbi:uncharacterized protein LOC110690363 isoform X2 [Chenopodium quinoa]|uniref:uncharacterized protein LOC110690363 isoform X2 n=1 Tax=Chenopodium quinoa TaxID=63459 RepID=UPI000B77C963|nr:uncharacterized protein LOC110690363 isoform X2 [Chenopodium quinoa]XP_021722877.1 uncharacterized protein LOC110690363 isoform X2 [Chenopodium quinoa]
MFNFQSLATQRHQIGRILAFDALYDLQHSGVYDIIGKHEDSVTCIEYSPETDYLTVSAGPLDLQWLALPLPSSTYYIALYFADDRASSRRAFDISINNVPYVRNLSVTPSGVAVFATKWPLDGLTRLRFTPVNGSDASPLINGGEIFDVLSLGNSA